MSPKKNLSQINYLSPIKYLLAIMSLSERSADNILAQASQVFVWKIKGYDFSLGQLSICLKDQFYWQSCLCLKDQLKIFSLRPVKYLSERSIDNTSASHIWKIKGHYFGLGQSSICLKYQLTILRLGLIKNLSERSIDNTSASHIWKIKGH